MTQHYTIEINAFTSLFFKGNGSFNAGEDSYTRSVFPPSPSVLYGFLQSVIYNTDSTKRNVAGYTAGKLPDNSLAIKGIQLQVSKNITIGKNSNFESIFPLPMDIVFPKNQLLVEKMMFVELIEDIFNKGVYGSQLPKVKLKTAVTKLHDTNGRVYLTKRQFENYLAGGPVSEILNLDLFITSETKVGLGRNVQTSVAEEGMLYSIEMIRPEGIFSNNKINTLNIAIAFETSITYPNTGISRIGGEGRLVEYKIANATKAASTELKIENNSVIKMVLCTPAVFNDFTLSATLEQNGFQLIAVLTDKYQVIGGWDIVKKEPKMSYRTAPAGTVYFLKVIDRTKAVDFVKENNGMPLQEINGPDNIINQGYCQVYFAQLNSQHQK